jgi:hypothetical protein
MLLQACDPTCTWGIQNKVIMLPLQFQTTKDYVKRQATSETNCNHQTHWCGNIMADTAIASPTSFSTIDILDTTRRQLHISASPTTHCSPRVPFLKSQVFNKWQFYYHAQTATQFKQLELKILNLEAQPSTPNFLLSKMVNLIPLISTATLPHQLVPMSHTCHIWKWFSP